MPTTTRGLRYPASTDTPDVPRDIGNLASDVDGLWRTGTLAARPAADTVKVGTEYYATDNGHYYLSTGAAWIDIGGSDVVRNASPTITGTATIGSDGQAIESKGYIDIPRQTAGNSALRVFFAPGGVKDANPRLNINIDPAIQFGAGGASAPDAFITRDSVAGIRIANNLRVANALTSGDSTGRNDAKTHYGFFDLYRTAGQISNSVVRIFNAAEAQPRLQIMGSGRIQWTDGTTVQGFIEQTTGGLSISGTLTTSGGFTAGGNISMSANGAFIQRNAATDATLVWASRKATDTFDTLSKDADGKISWGTGAAAPDASLSRPSAGLQFDIPQSGILTIQHTAHDGTGATPSHTIRLRGGSNGTSVINSQILLSYSRTDLYQHRISSRHNSAQRAQNAIDFFLWQQGTDTSTTPGTLRAMYIEDSATGARVVINGRLEVGTRQTYAASNVTTDRTYDANATTIDELADVLGTLIADLRTIGLVL